MSGQWKKLVHRFSVITGTKTYVFFSKIHFEIRANKNRETRLFNINCIHIYIITYCNKKK